MKNVYEPKIDDKVRVLVDKSIFHTPIDCDVPHYVYETNRKCSFGGYAVVIRENDNEPSFFVRSDQIEPWTYADVNPEQAQTSQNTYQALGTEIGALVDAKQAQYGNSFGKCGDFLRILYPDGVAPEAYTDVLTLVRIFDKCMRIANGGHGDNESPYRDIAGYGLLGEMEAQKGGVGE